MSVRTLPRNRPPPANPLELPVQDIIAATRLDPVWNIRTILGEDPWDMQQEIARSVFANPLTAVAACHASGKTRIAAAIVHAYLQAYPKCKILTTAPTWLQVEKLLWAEIGSMYTRLPASFGFELLTTQLRASLDWWAMGLSTDQGVRFQGHHAPKILVVFDEAVGVKGEIWEALEGIRAGGDVNVLALGNPTHASGPFYEAHTRGKAWKAIRISAFDTPNLVDLGCGRNGERISRLLDLDEDALGVNPRPYLVRRRWVREMYEKWGPTSPLWESRVLGIFPQESADSLIGLRYIEQARQEPDVDDGASPVHIGIDVAGPGEDETVVCVRSGRNLLAIRSFSDADPRARVLEMVTPWFPRLVRCAVDSAGIGYYFYLAIRDAFAAHVGAGGASLVKGSGTGGVVTGVNVGEASAQPDQFHLLKAQLYWALRDRFREGDIAGLPDDETITQLASLRYHQDTRNRVVIETKDQARARGIGSPDRAEAIMLAFAEDMRVPGFLVAMRGMIDARRAGQDPAAPPAASKSGIAGAMGKEHRR